MNTIKIAYIGGGSHGWAWGLMSDLALCSDICGEVALYDINLTAASTNVSISKKINDNPQCISHWKYYSTSSIKEALTNADFVIISILPGTFSDMAIDVHDPVKYGIYQPVGDTTGPGGFRRMQRTFEPYIFFANSIKETCPNAWVINYTNPMSLCVRTLYKTFPGIKAIGCCHEVFGTQELIAQILASTRGIPVPNRKDIKVSVGGINHFTWFTKITYNSEDLLSFIYNFSKSHRKDGFTVNNKGNLNRYFICNNKVKFDICRKYGILPAAGDRHLVEFFDGDIYLHDLQAINKFGFSLTPVSWRIEHKDDLDKLAYEYAKGYTTLELKPSGEEGVNIIRALLGLEDLYTNINYPNLGQMPDFEKDIIVETNALITKNNIVPEENVTLPVKINNLIKPHIQNRELQLEGYLTNNVNTLFRSFINDPLITCDHNLANRLFDSYIINRKTII